MTTEAVGSETIVVLSGSHRSRVNPLVLSRRRTSNWAYRRFSSICHGKAITGNGWDVTKKHRVDNGRIDVIKAFTPGGDIVLANGWVVGIGFGHIKHGLVQTSPATQSKTDDIVLASMNNNSLGAMSAEQGYVTVSRGRERGMIFTDLSRDELLKAIASGDNVSVR
jgi:hypothetical protein